MGLAVINCASEHNTQTCRDYDIMGYPTLKVFAGGALAGDRGAPLQPTPHDVPSLEAAYVSWVVEQQSKGRPPLKPDLTLTNKTAAGWGTFEFGGIPFLSWRFLPVTCR